MLLLTLIKESFLFAWFAIMANKLRTFLSLLGITIGIFSIIAVFTVVDNLELQISESINELGSNVINVEKWAWDGGPNYPWWKYMQRPNASIGEAMELEKRIQTADGIVFTAGGNGKVKYENLSTSNASLIGVTYDYYKIKSFELIAGRYFTPQEITAGSNIAIIGYTIAEGLFKNAEMAMDKDIFVEGRKTRVIGVFKKEGESMFGNSSDKQVCMSIFYGQNFFNIRDERSGPAIAVKAKPKISNEQLRGELTGAMRSIRSLKPNDDDSFALNEISAINQEIQETFNVIGIAGWIIGGFSILVGGFGIANIMFVSVKERTQLIGIQKSLGAKNYFILIQFIFESILLSLIGGLLGLLMVKLSLMLAASVFEYEAVLTWGNIVLALTVSFLIGLISGFIPAYSASQLDPVEAIRS
jgi:putative ABC transport system permease protein